MLGVERVAIVGMSQGARVALRWAMRLPRATTCLVLDGPPRDLLAVGRPQGEITLAAYRELVRNEGIEAFRKAMAGASAHAPAHARARARTLAARDGRSLSGPRPAGATMPTQLPASATCSRLDLPVLIINGEHDSDARIGAGAELARALPRCAARCHSRRGTPVEPRQPGRLQPGARRIPLSLGVRVMQSRVGVIVGSLRKAAYTRMLARALPELTPPSLQLVEIGIGDLPLYNYDLETDNAAAGVDGIQDCGQIDRRAAVRDARVQSQHARRRSRMRWTSGRDRGATAPGPASPPASSA